MCTVDCQITINLTELTAKWNIIMKIKKLKLKNFRCFHDEVEINFDNFTAFVGKNDAGKSSLLEALDIFFNDSSAISKLEQEDLNIDARDCEEKDNEISITVCFSDLPKIITIDQTNIRIYTKCLLNIDGELEISDCPCGVSTLNAMPFTSSILPNF